MPSTQDVFDKWLDQGFIEYEGWYPANTRQGRVAQEYGLSLGPYSERGRRRQGGGGLPFSRTTSGSYSDRAGPWGGVGSDARKARWTVNSKQDILDYLEFANKMGVHNTQRRKGLGIPEYTSQDIYDYFIRPEEGAGLERAEAGALAAAERGGTAAASEAGRVGTSAYGGAPGVRERAIAGVGEAPNVTDALRGSRFSFAQALEGDPERLSTYNMLRDSAIGPFSGLRANIDLNETIGKVGWGVSGGGGSGGVTAAADSGGGASGGGASGGGGGGMGPGAIAALISKFVGMGFGIGGDDQARLYRERLREVGSRLGATPAVASWSSRMPGGGRASQSMAPTQSFEGALGGLYDDEGKSRSGYLFG